jgi:uncharacterized protein (TIGR03067 family)
MRFMIALLISSIGSVELCADDSNENPLLGSWEPVSVVVYGSTLEDDVSSGQLDFTEDGYTITRKISVLHYKYKLYPDKNPKQFDAWWVSEKEFLDKKNDPKEQRPPDTKGIYSIEDDGQTLRRCYSARGNPRPKEFDSVGGSKNILTVHKRVKND